MIKYNQRPSTCSNAGEVIEVEEVCCGGKKKIVTGTKCKIRGNVGPNTCVRCKDFKKNEN